MAKRKKMKIEKPTKQSKKMKIEKPTISYDIILEILHRLPVKSLLRFTRVSKSWKASIKSSNFISAHHQINKNISCSHLVYMQQNGSKYCSLIPESCDGVLTRMRIPFPPLRSGVSVVGSDEGLVCLRTYSDVYVWNPFIRIMKRINPAFIRIMKRINPVGQFRDLYKRLGFGFAPQSGDYKIVKLLVEGEYLTGADIYSLSSDSWTRIKSPSGRLERYKIFSLCSHVSFKGSIYWLINLYGQEDSVSMILRIDLDKQTIEEMEIDAAAINPRTNIMVADGFLVLLKSDIRGNQIIPVQSFIYKESTSSWSAIRIGDLPTGKVVGLTRSGHIILQRSPNGQIFVCDPYYDGTYLNFRSRDLGINVDSCGFGLIIPIKETLHLLDEETA